MIRGPEMTVPFREIRAARLADEVGTIPKQAELPFALCYPSPYPVGMSSLGFQTIYRRLNALPGVAAERAFLPRRRARPRAPTGEPLRTYESMRPVGDFPVVAFSLAYELELAGLSTASTSPASRSSPTSAPPTPAATRWSSSAGPSPSRTPSRRRPTPTSCSSARPRRRLSSWSRRSAAAPSRDGAARPRWPRAPASTCRPCTARRRRRSPPPTTPCCPRTRRSGRRTPSSPTCSSSSPSAAATAAAPTA